MQREVSGRGARARAAEEGGRARAPDRGPVNQARGRNGECDMAPLRPRPPPMTASATQDRRPMQVGDICTREVVCASSETTVAAAARTMRQYHIGDVVVTRLENGRRIPLGIVTDRDIVIGVVATDLAPNTLTV